MPRNPYLCLTIVLTLGLTMLLGLGGVILLTFAGKEPPSSLVAVISGCAGSLSSFLVSVPRGSAGWDDPNAPKRP